MSTVLLLLSLIPGDEPNVSGTVALAPLATKADVDELRATLARIEKRLTSLEARQGDPFAPGNAADSAISTPLPRARVVVTSEFAAPAFLGYRDACLECQRTGCPLAVYVNRRGQATPGWIVTEVPSFAGDPTPRLVLARPGRTWPEYFPEGPPRAPPVVFPTAPPVFSPAFSPGPVFGGPPAWSRGSGGIAGGCVGGG